MAYFKKVSDGDKVFGLVFGPGIVENVMTDSHYTFMVRYKNDFIVPYTEDGIPGWNSTIDFQTVYYKTDIDIEDLDFGPVNKILSPKKIIKLRARKKLMVKCPSGLWQTLEHCPKHLVESYLEDKKFHLFKSKKE